jgi:hypothetical protein
MGTREVFGPRRWWCVACKLCAIAPYASDRNDSQHIPLLIGLLALAWGVGVLPVRAKSRGSLSREDLLSRCDNVILGWKNLAEDYQNSHKGEGQPLTLPNPMDPGWRTYGHKDWLFPVGYFQAATHDLRRDLSLKGIEVGDWNLQRMSMATLEEALDKYRRQLSGVR